MKTRVAAREALEGLVQDARHGNSRDRAVGASWLLTLSGREWLLLDDVARGPAYLPAPVAGVKGWLSPASRELSGFAAAIASMHVDGRIRERATRLLAEQPGALRSAALAVRCLDHVPQVRDAALAAASARTGPDDAEAIVGVLAAAPGRAAARTAMAAYGERLLAGAAAATTLAVLRTSTDREVRRWAFQAAMDRDLLSGDDVLLAATGDPDQVVRARCCAWLGTAGTAVQLTALLEARFPDGRVVALQHLAEQDLSAQQLQACLLDRSARVRATAQWRARRRDLDVASIYRRALTEHPTRTAPALAGLVALGTSDDLVLVEPYLQDARPAVRAGAVRALAAHLPPTAARERLPRVMLDPSPQVTMAAARALERCGVTPAAAEPAWQSHQEWSRKAVWRVQRVSGGWQRVQADLRASNDLDPGLAGAGRTGLGNWLVHGAATAWNPPTAAQKLLIQQLLPTSGLSPDTQRLLAFHAGIAPTSQASGTKPEHSAKPLSPEGTTTPGVQPQRLSLRARLARAWGTR